MDKNFEKLIESAKLSGRIDLLMEMREWLDDKMADAEQQNDLMREEVKEGGK